LPTTVTRQALRLYTASPDYIAFLQPTYDVVERVVSYRLGRGAFLEPGVLYHVELYQPEEQPQGLGFRAFDGAPLVEGDVPVVISFVTAKAVPETAPAPAEPPDCAAALDVLGGGSCPACHAPGNAAMDLELDSGDGLRRTAIRHVAHEADTAPLAGRPLVAPSRFGAGMPIVEPGNPGTSYLMYKLLLHPGNYGEGGCTSEHLVASPSGVCAAPPETERQRLADWFVQMDPMPPVGALPNGIDDLRTMRDFITAGASTTACQ
jgi:hypothetical protein